MAKVVVYGVTGFTGGNIARELVSRGHEVTGVARNIADFAIDGVTVAAGDINDLAGFAANIDGASDVILALRHSEPKLAPLVPAIIEAAARAGVRVGVIGGAGSLKISENGPRLIDTPEFPKEYLAEATDAVATLDALKASANGDWFYVSPAQWYGSYVPGERLGAYRLGLEVLITDENGKSAIGGEDFAIAIVDEIETKTHRNQRFTLGY
mgnify:CR=1 FL=1